MKRFELYRMRDNKTPLSESYFNPIWADLDARLDNLEALKISWEDAIVTISQYGLLRIDEVLRPSWEYIEQKKTHADSIIAEIQELREEADEMINERRDDAIEAVDSAKSSALNDIEQAKEQAINQLDLNNIYAMTFFFGGD